MVKSNKVWQALHFFTKIAFFFVLICSFKAQAFIVAFDVDPSDPLYKYQWPHLTKQEAIEEIKFHKSRVALLSLRIGGYMGLTTENQKTALYEIANVHDNAKLEMRHFEKLYMYYQRSGAVPEEVINDLNLRDDVITKLKVNEMLLAGLVSQAEVERILLAIELADKIDRPLYPKALAKKVFHVRTETLNSPEFNQVKSPEFNKVMAKIRDFENVSLYIKKYKNLGLGTALVNKAIDFAELNYLKWVTHDFDLIPGKLYSLKCDSVFQ